MNARDRAGRRTPVPKGPRGAVATAPRPAGTRPTGARPATDSRDAQRDAQRARSRSHHPVNSNRGPHARRTPRPPAKHRKPVGPAVEKRLARRKKERQHKVRVWRSGKPQRRLIVVFAFTALAFSFVLLRVGLLQIAEAQDYQEYGDRQRVRSEVIQAPRGAILDRDGNELAMSVPSKTVFANPKAIVNPDETVDALAQLLGLTKERQESLLAAFAAADNEFVYVARQVEPEIAASVDALDMPGIGVRDEPRRFEPAGDVARGVVGRTDIDGVGIGGIELQYNPVLTGKQGQLRREFGTQGRSMPSGDKALVDAVPGNDVQLTIDSTLQYRVEQYLLDAVDEMQARGGSAIVLDTHTGEVLSMASVRRNDEQETTEIASGNFAAVDSYEPGSVAKVITIAAGLNENAVTPDRTFVVPNTKKFYDLELHDADSHPTQPYTVRQILVKSSNIGTIFVSQEIGTERQEEYMRAFGLGEVTALDFPGEGRGILKPTDQLFGTERVTLAYGQGVASTAIQLVSAVNVIANDGTYVAPKIVKSIISSDGTVQESMPSATRSVVRPEVAREVNLMMREVVCSGTAKGRIDVPGYTVAGKTGTGYKAQPNGTYFDEDGNRAYYASFVGFFPAEAPRVTILVSIDEPPPDAAHFGATTAAPVFGQIAAAAIVELGIQPATVDGGCPKKESA